MPYDLIQEWGFGRTALEELGKVDGEPIVHAITDASQSVVVGVTRRHVFTVEMEGGKISVVHEVPGSGRLGLGSKGGIFGQDGPSHSWRYGVASSKLQRNAITLPGNAWDKAPLNRMGEVMFRRLGRVGTGLFGRPRPI